MMQDRRKNAPMHGPMGRMVFEKPKDFRKSMDRLVRYLRNYWFPIVTALTFAVIGTVCAIFGPKVISKMNEEIIISLKLGVSINFSKITTFGTLLIVLYVISFSFGFLQNFIMSGVTAKISQKMRSEIDGKINRLPLKYFDRNSYGDVLSRVTNDVDTIGQTLNQSLSSMITSVTMVVGVIIMMFTISWELTLINLVSLPISLVLLGVIVKSSQKFFKRQQEDLGLINGHIEEIYSAHNIVKVFNGDQSAQKQFDVINEKLYKSAYKSQFWSGLMMPVMTFVGNLNYVFICVIGGAMALKDPLFIASIVAFITYVRQFSQPLSQLATITNTLQSTAAAAERVFDFLSEPEQENEEQKLIALDHVQGNVEFRNVCFGYDEKEIIHDFSCRVQAGQKIAIVGPTGAGKTTIVNLLMRFYETNSGEILIDGVPTQNMKREYVRSLFGMVLQDTWLFEGTIRDNLTFGHKDATEAEIVQACEAANIDHFIRALPNSYQLVLSEDSNLSQGERQLLSIARAMIQNAPMLILDEATSSVDTRTEILIQKAMDALMKGRTSFVIAHRLSTIKNADLILVMRDGRIVETGKHEELLAQAGFYSELYNSQFSENE